MSIKLKSLCFGFLLLASGVAFANAAVKLAPVKVKTFPVNHVVTIKSHRVPMIAVILPVKKPNYQATVYASNLKANLARISTKFHWHLIWKLGSDNFHVLSQSQYRAQSFSDLFSQMIKNYRLKANFYTKNKVVVVKWS